MTAARTQNQVTDMLRRINSAHDAIGLPHIDVMSWNPDTRPRYLILSANGDRLGRAIVGTTNLFNFLSLHLHIITKENHHG